MAGARYLFPSSEMACEQVLRNKKGSRYVFSNDSSAGQTERSVTFCQAPEPPPGQIISARPSFQNLSLELQTQVLLHLHWREILRVRRVSIPLISRVYERQGYLLDM